MEADNLTLQSRSPELRTSHPIVDRQLRPDVCKQQSNNSFAVDLAGSQATYIGSTVTTNTFTFDGSRSVSNTTIDVTESPPRGSKGGVNGDKEESNFQSEEPPALSTQSRKKARTALWRLQNVRPRHRHRGPSLPPLHPGPPRRPLRNPPSHRLSQCPVAHDSRRRSALHLAHAQRARNTENAYRACAGLTAFKVQDPDPNAVDAGRVLGVRVNVPVPGGFAEMYYVLLNRGEGGRLRVHRHTVPACVALALLVQRWLGGGEGKGGEQDLVRFGRTLRRELVGWHLRKEVVRKLREEAGLKDGDGDQKEEESHSVGVVLNAFVSDDEDEEDDDEAEWQSGPVRIIDIEADMGVREVKVSWSDGRVGIMKVTKDSEIDRVVVSDQHGSRDMALSRKAVGRIEGLVQRLKS
ncbi:hypothetical protein BS50DRAFT_595214 [Corynespora cassiicola Philippines]|uniref:Uncharacterized protein n=1 Tax=Corynespora cassiicola Philippines TaxID=1448308 RepID=A0A2T2MZV5_CORCC|nr:hypothetical protein BS50DRAFT_595214 [Corynespora cassiicola Philippines]